MAKDAKAYDRLQKAKCRLITKEPFYGTICMMMDFIESDRCPTMGVMIKSSGIVACFYGPQFLNSITLEQLYAVLKHECEHIIRLHPVREQARMKHDAFNVATDFTINGKKSSPTCVYLEEGKKPVPPIEDGCYIPEDWPANETAEYYYDRLPKCPECGNVVPWDHKTGEAKQNHNHQGGESKGEGEGEDQNECSGDGDGDGNGQEDNPHCCSGCGRGKGSGNYVDGDAGGRLIDDHDIWLESELSQDETRQVVKQIVDKAVAHSKGNMPGHVQQILDELDKPIIRWREIVRQFMGKHCGGTRKTFSRINRRNPRFGIKGNSHRAVAKLGVIADVSGSTASYMKQFFAEIEAVGTKADIWVLQWDTELKHFHPRYRKGDWKKIHPTGFGGTAMEKAQKWVVQNQPATDCVIMLTDGFTDWRKEAMPMPFLVVLTQENDVPEYARKIVMPNQD
jgi:predicted metal-dependent peptidase